MFLVIGVLHEIEEYVYPGGFLEILQHYYKSTHQVTVRLAIVINALFIFLCIAGIVVASRNLAFSLSVASVLFYNSVMHIYTAIDMRRYTPGLISAIALHLPLSLYAYFLFASAGELNFLAAGLSVLLGALYLVVPVGLFALSKSFMRDRH